MGYTHYYTQNRSLTNREWKDLIDIFHHMLNHLPAHSHNAGGFYADFPLTICGGDGTGQPEINDRSLVFNGDEKGGLDHETFYIDKDGHGFYFCKTARKPYDLLVCAVLLALCEIAPAAFELSSDGDMAGEEWQPARDFLRSLPPMPKTANVINGEPLTEMGTLFSMPIMEVTT